MPLFVFICEKCKAESEMLVNVETRPVCPECGSAQMERQLGRFAPMSARPAEPACGGCAFGEQGRCPSAAACHE